MATYVIFIAILLITMIFLQLLQRYPKNTIADTNINTDTNQKRQQLSRANDNEHVPATTATIVAAQADQSSTYEILARVHNVNYCKKDDLPAVVAKESYVNWGLFRNMKVVPSKYYFDNNGINAGRIARVARKFITQQNVWRKTTIANNDNDATVPDNASPWCRRLDQETKVLRQLWHQYDQRCETAPVVCATLPLYTERLQHRKDLTYLVQLCLVNLIDANDVERLLQLGCILLLYVTKQFHDELETVFRTNISSFFAIVKLQQIDQLCADLEKQESSQWVQWYDESFLRWRNIQPPAPNIQIEPTTRSAYMADKPDAFFFCSHYGNPLTVTIRPRLIIPHEHLSRVCTINGMCIDRPPMILYDNIKPSFRPYIAHAWTHWRKSTSSSSHTIANDVAHGISTIVFVDGSIATHVHNPGSNAITVPIYRVSCDMINVTDAQYPGGHELYSLRIKRRSPRETTVTMTVVSRDSRTFTNTSTTGCKIHQLLESMWYSVNFTVQPYTNTLILQRTVAVTYDNNSMAIDWNFEKQWLRLSFDGNHTIDHRIWITVLEKKAQFDVVFDAPSSPTAVMAAIHSFQASSSS